MTVLEDLRQAREAYERREWVSAYRALSDLDDTDLAAADFLALATTAHLLGHRNDCVQALQRAYQVCDTHDDPRGAIRAAFWLALILTLGGEPAVGGGWVSRAERMLADVGDDVVERGYVLVHRMFRQVHAGEFPAALDTADAIADYGRRFHDPDLLAFGLNGKGRGLTMGGRVAEGLQLLDEAMVGVVAGEVSPIISGMVYCSMIEACQWVSDYGRVGEWTHALTEWCARQPGLVAFTGQCAVHRGQLMRLHGAYGDAVRELEHAAARYAAAGGNPAVGQAHYERGDVLRLRGDHAAAEAAYAEAAELGHPAQPGRALLWLEIGRTATALSAMRRVLAERQSPVQRSQVLPAAVDVFLTAGEVDEAAPLAEELCAAAATFGCTALQAAGAYADAAVALARGEADRAFVATRRAVDGWRRLAAPYEVARCQVLIAQALRLLHDEESASAELVAARKGFADLGAVPAERAVAELAGERVAPGGLSPREIEVVRLVAAGMSNPEIAAELVLAEKTVARHLSNIFTKLDVGSRTAAAAFAYEHGLV